ncbi:tetratricopeptide repeat protein [Geoalkalibacter halelectricus]|uniref:tetratricopeptide repeat protein n=1 Tax=Geoalkalibacter halelectricus TaxID=2847045 RepID=UPI003D19F2EF
MKNFIAVCFLVVFGVACIQSGVHAVTSVRVLDIVVSPEEFSVLPEMLQVRIQYGQKHNHPSFKMWHGRVGPDYIHYHHWALGIVTFNRGKAENNQQRKTQLMRRAAGEFNYVLNQSSPNNPHRYYLHYQRGEALMATGDFNNAAIDFTQSIKLNRNHLPSYLRLGEIYSVLGMHQQAQEIEILMKETFSK